MVFGLDLCLVAVSGRAGPSSRWRRPGRCASRVVLLQKEVNMRRNSRKSGARPWLGLAVAGLTAVSALAAAAAGGDTASQVTAGGPSGCVIVQLAK